MKNGKKLMCPICGKRACDISTFPKEEMSVEVKCPNCHNLVIIPCDISAEKDRILTRIVAYAAEMDY